ncbi:MAG: type IV pilus secretin PilQ [Gammaproteobacteria bacterium]|nr:type IV pilus secretin PilQ [Gammaproteobacteria bacterium]
MTPPGVSRMSRTYTQQQFWGISSGGFIHKLWRCLAIVALYGGVAAAANAQNITSSNALVDIEVVPLAGQQIQLQLRTSGTAPEPLSFTIENPARISLDLPNTSLALPSRRTDVDLGALRTILAAEGNGRTRVVLNLDEMVSYETRVQGDSIFVTLGASSTSASASTSPFSGTTAAPPVSYDTGFKAIDNIDFRRGADGAGRVVVTMSDPATVVDIKEEGNSVIVEFADTALPGGLQRRYDVMDFATPVATVDASQRGGNARVVIGSSVPFEQVAYQSDNLLTVELRPYTPSAQEQLEEKQTKEYTGERLTLNFQDIETRAVLQLLADVSGQNIVVSDTVQGNVTLRLQSVPWDQALDIVLQTKGLDMRQNDNVIIVAPSEEIAARERQELEALAQFEELAPLRSEFIQVNYAKASDLAALVGSAGGTDTSLLSERGSISIDERTNTLLVQDTAEKLTDIRRLVQRLDVPVRQVLIESRIVVVNDDFRRALGVRAGYTHVTDNSSDGLMSVSGSADANNTTVNSGLNNLNAGNPVFPVAVGTLADRLAVNLPVTSPAGRLALSILDSDYLVDLELSALQAEGRGEIISTPRVITANQKEARIEQGVEIPFQEASSSGATTTQFKKAVLSLTVTPLITPDDRIIMDLIVSQDSVGESVPSATGGFVPSIDTREVVTQVLVSNGETVVLGGIYETERREVDSKVPMLGDLPVLGHLFRTTERTSNKSELLIFVTPKILKEGANLN